MVVPNPVAEHFQIDAKHTSIIFILLASTGSCMATWPAPVAGKTKRKMIFKTRT